MTKGDFIRTYNDDELAIFITMVGKVFCGLVGATFDEEHSIEYCKKKLKEEYKGDEDSIF